MEQKVIKGSGIKAAAFLTLFLAFDCGGLLMIQDPTAERGWAWFCVIFFGLGTLAFLLQLFRPNYLLLDGDGFTLLGGLVRSPKQILWKDVQPFFVYRASRGGKFVGFNFEPAANKSSFLIKLNTFFGAQGGLPGGWQLSTQEMVDELNAYRRQALDRMS